MGWGKDGCASAPIALNSAPRKAPAGGSMAEEHATIIPQVLAENEQALLRDWMESQKKSGALRSGQISEAELTENSRRLLAGLRGAAATGQFDDITAPIWDQSRTVLEDVSRSRATLGLTPAETATFVFSLKEPLFALLRQKDRQGSGPAGGRDLESNIAPRQARAIYRRGFSKEPRGYHHDHEGHVRSRFHDFEPRMRRLSSVLLWSGGR